jgi:hypothetical protein
MQDATPDTFTIEPQLAISRILTHKVDLLHDGDDVHLLGHRAEHLFGLFVIFGAVTLFIASCLLGPPKDTITFFQVLSAGICACGVYYACKVETIALSSENNNIVTHSSILAVYNTERIINQGLFDTLIHRPVSKLKQNGRRVYSYALLMRFKNGGEYTLAMGQNFDELQAQSLQISSALNIPIINEK